MAAKPLAPGSLTAAAGIGRCSCFRCNAAKAAPPIRTSDRNPVPACVTPERLMAFLAERNSHRRSALSRNRPLVQTLRRRLARAVGLRLLSDGDRNQLSEPIGAETAGAETFGETQNNFAGIGATGTAPAANVFPT